MANPTLQIIQDRARELYDENCKEYPYRIAFDFATELAFNEFNVGKPARFILRAAISKTFGPCCFQAGEPTSHKLERCVRILYEYGVDIDSGLTEALRQYRVEYFPNRIAFRKQLGRFIGHSGGVRAQELARERKASSQKPAEPPSLSLF